MSDEQTAEPFGSDAAPLSNRFTRGTLLGCLGIACVLAMPALLFLPLDEWHVPGWLALLVPLVAVGLLALGGLLLARVPAGSAIAARTPWRPLTVAGAPPLVERPATRANRLGALAASVFVAVVLVATLIIASGAFHRRALPVAIVLVGLAGVGLAVYGVLVGLGRLPSPAWRWVRTPIRGVARSAAPLVLGGLAALAWALLVAADAGFHWAYVGLAALVVGGVLAAPLARRVPRE